MPGHLFAALPGTKVHGAHFIETALAQGAVAVLTDAEGAQLAGKALAESDVALVIAAVQDRPAAEVAQMDVVGALEPFDLRNQLSSNRTQGVPNMIALVKEHAARISAG